MVAVQQKLGTHNKTSHDLDFACHLMFITSFSNGKIMNQRNVSQLPATPDYSNACTAFLCIIYAPQFSSEMLHTNVQY